MAQVSLWSSIAKSLGIAGKGKGGPREKEIERLVGDLSHENPDKRRSAAWSLAKMKPPPKESLERLLEMAERDPDPFVRKSAHWAANTIRGKP